MPMLALLLRWEMADSITLDCVAKMRCTKVTMGLIDLVVGMHIQTEAPKGVAATFGKSSRIQPLCIAVHPLHGRSFDIDSHILTPPIYDHSTALQAVIATREPVIKSLIDNVDIAKKRLIEDMTTKMKTIEDRLKGNAE